MINIIKEQDAFSLRVIGTLFLCLVLAMSLAWPQPARAQTYSVSELQNMLAQILLRLGELSINNPKTVCPYNWSRSMGRGATGADVMRLQQFLNSSPDTSLAVSGVGSPGLETQFYGPLTAAAVSKFQTKHRAVILTPLGLTSPTGYFGPASMGEANRLCSNPGNMPVPVGDLRGGAGSLSRVELMGSIGNEEVGEDREDVEVLGLKVTPDGSDIEISAVTIDFDALSGITDDLEDYATEVSVWLNGKKYASVDADNFEDDDYEHTITLDRGAIIREGQEGDLTVAVSAVSNLDSSNVGDGFEVRVQSLRFRDAQGAVITDRSMDNLSREFTFVEFADSGDVGFRIVSGDDSINDGRVITVSSNDRTRDEEVLSFTVEAEGESDLTIEDLRVSATTTGGVLGDVISAAYLYRKGSRVDSKSITGSGETIVFDNVDLDIAASDEVEFEVRVDFREANGVNYGSGATIQLSVTADDRNAWVVEDERSDDVANADRRGSAYSDPHILATEGAMVTMISSNTSETYNSSNPSTSYGEFRMMVELRAVNDAIYVAETATRDNDPSSGHGATYYFTDSSNNEYSQGNVSYAFNRLSGGSMENGYVRINPGQTARFELVATLDPADFGQYRMQLVSIGWNDIASAPDSYSRVVPESSYRTVFQTISE